ncbi:hypothetical protein [Oligoflexus tunisiensis]|uniref:hypothetical protein n=1 Tax=Oligoflexus tunisiensis TaxID=708132 RepID=UPI00114CD535|nr:hypothetical protein [Oligoflexus tunisiensis]
MPGKRIMLATLLLPTLGQGQNLDPRTPIVDDFVEQRAQNPGLYQSPPINHIVPSRNTITYAGQFEEVNLKLMEKPEGLDDVNPNNVVTVTGYKLEPHLALSLKNIAIGFSIERSRLAEEWTYSDTNYTYERKQKSTLETSGLGLNLAFLPFPKLHKKLRLAMILGGKSLNVKHGLSYVKSQNGPVSILGSDMQSFRYTVNHYEAGLNLSWFVLKRFAIVPWMDYATYDIKGAQTIFNSDKYASGELKSVMENDLNLFFMSYPKFRYGLDFAVQVLGLEVRIGGLLGTLANLNKSVDYIEDNSVTISVSVEQKGN